MKKSSRKAMLLAAVLALQSWLPAMAAEPGTVFSTKTREEEIVAYVQNPGEAENVEFQIGTQLCGDVQVRPVAGEEIPLKTIILVDNSLSVVEKYRPFIQQTLQDIVADRLDREQFDIAVFGEDIQYLVRDSSDYAQIKQVVDGITYQDRETYLTDVLYDLLKELEASEDSCFKRIVIVSDGVDNKSIGYTKEELYDLIGQNPYPVYTLGCTYKDNGEQLKNMFALSRMTNGRSYLLDEVTDPLTVINDLSADRDILKVTAVPDSALCDGSRKAVQITFHTASGDITGLAEVKMPFAVAQTQPQTEAESKSEPETEGQPEEPDEEKPGEEEPDEEPENGPGVPLMALAVGAVVFLILVTGITVTVVVIVKKKNKKENFEPFNGSSVQNRPPQGMPAKADTEWLNQGGSRKKTDSTQMLLDDQRNYSLFLADQKNLAKTFECPLVNSVVVGRKPELCQLVLDYDKSVSGRHCEIFIKNGKFYIRDLNSSNGTFVNGSRVLTDAEVYSGCILTLGRLTLKMEIH